MQKSILTRLMLEYHKIIDESLLNANFDFGKEELNSFSRIYGFFQSVFQLGQIDVARVTPIFWQTWWPFKLDSPTFGDQNRDNRFDELSANIRK